MGVCKVYKCNMTRAYLENDRLNVWHDSYIREKWFFSWKMIFWMCDMTLTYVRNDCMKNDLSHDSYLWENWLFSWDMIYLMFDMTPLHTRELLLLYEESSFTIKDDSHLREKRLFSWEMILRMCDVTRTYVRNDSFACVTTTKTGGWNDSFIGTPIVSDVVRDIVTGLAITYVNFEFVGLSQ